MRHNILISGASSGLGAQMAREFAARGRNLALCARRSERLEQLRDELTAAHPDITIAIRTMDVTEPDQVFDGVGSLATELGTLDRVIVNAGIGKGQPIGTGHLVIVSSLLAFRGVPRNATTYAATKAAVASLAEGLRAETRATKALRDIKITTLFPGYIQSEMNPDRTPLVSKTEPAVRTMISAMEREVGTAMVPPWPWAIAGTLMKVLPLSLVARFF